MLVRPICHAAMGVTGRDPLKLASELFALIEDAHPDRVVFTNAAPLLQHWADLKPDLVALGAADTDAEVRAAAVRLREAGNALFDCLALGLKSKLRLSEQEDLVKNFPERHSEAEQAAQSLLEQVA